MGEQERGPRQPSYKLTLTMTISDICSIFGLDGVEDGMIVLGFLGDCAGWVMVFARWVSAILTGRRDQTGPKDERTKGAKNAGKDKCKARAVYVVWKWAWISRKDSICMIEESTGLSSLHNDRSNRHVMMRDWFVRNFLRVTFYEGRV